MTDTERIDQGQRLRVMVEQSEGYKLLAAEIERRKAEGWRKFIKLPVDQKTSKRAYKHQADWDALEDLQDWITDKIKEGEQAQAQQAKRNK